MQKEEKIIMYDSPEAAEQITLTGWVSGGDKRFWYKDEHMARWSGCTHIRCECGGIVKKTWIKCDACRAKADRERFLAYPFREWDGVEPVCTSDGDKYFFHFDDLLEYMEENEMDEIQLLFCEENNWIQIQNDYWADYMPEDSDGDLPKELQSAVDAVNKIIETLPCQSYSPSKIRTEYKINQSLTK